MKLTINDILVLRALAEYYVLSAAQIHRICFPTHRDRRATRARLARLLGKHYLAKSPISVAFFLRKRRSRLLSHGKGL